MVGQMGSNSLLVRRVTAEQKGEVRRISTERFTMTRKNKQVIHVGYRNETLVKQGNNGIKKRVVPYLESQRKTICPPQYSNLPLQITDIIRMSAFVQLLPRRIEHQLKSGRGDIRVRKSGA